MPQAPRRFQSISLASPELSRWSHSHAASFEASNLFPIHYLLPTSYYSLCPIPSHCPILVEPWNVPLTVRWPRSSPSRPRPQLNLLRLGKVVTALSLAPKI